MTAKMFDAVCLILLVALSFMAGLYVGEFSVQWALAEIRMRETLIHKMSQKKDGDEKVD